MSQWEKMPRGYNGESIQRIWIGNYVLKSAKAFEQYGEYAADYCTVNAPAGEYPIYALRINGRAWHSVSVSIPGTIVSGSWWNKLQPGEKRTIHLNFYPHAIAKILLDGAESMVILNADILAKEIPFEFDGKQHKTYGLEFNGEQL